ncbi:uncharacterized protein LOC134191138 isoform X2 [Corticium candelabrum]|uniref:uncharacterized protein LOC134191138 isoform X2 n=1 Tax=Corticium candelabrum TaxID=121492 RepID=UPI002E264D19|nr:uncharacterized protein LOC134191138 isoform X2 [Corticium candelabrum]
MEGDERDPRRDYRDSGRNGPPTSGGRHQHFFRSPETMELPPVMRSRSCDDILNDTARNEQPDLQRPRNRDGWQRYGVPVLPVRCQRGQRGLIRDAVRLDSSSTSGIDSASSSERRCKKIEINPHTVQVHTSVMLWLAFTDASGLPSRNTEVAVGFYSSRDRFRKTFVRGTWGPNSLTVQVKNPVWTEPDNVIVEVRTAIEPDGRVLGVGHLQFVLPPLATPHLISLLGDPSTGSITEMLMNLFQNATERSAETSERQRCSNIPSRNVSTAYIICKPDDYEVKEAYASLLEQLEQSSMSRERVDKLDQSTKTTPDEKVWPSKGTTTSNSQDTNGLYEVVSVVPSHKSRAVPPVPAISLPDDTGLTVPRSINFNPEVLTVLLQQVESNEITAMKAIEEMRTIVYHDPTKIMVQKTSISQNNRRSARENTEQQRHEDLPENRSRTPSDVSNYNLDKRAPPNVKKKKERPHSSDRSTCGPKTSIDIQNNDQSSLHLSEDSETQLTDAQTYSDPEKHPVIQSTQSDSGVDTKQEETEQVHEIDTV